MKKEDKLFFSGLFFLTLTLFLFPFTAYLFPKAVLGWEYYIPDAIVSLVVRIHVILHISYELAFLYFMLFLFSLSLFTGLLAYLTAHKLSQMELQQETQDKSPAPITKKVKQNSRESTSLVLKMIFFITLVFIVANVIQWAISSPPPGT